MSNNKRKIKGICPKCFENKEIILHTLFPELYFEKNDWDIYLCQEYSDKLKDLLKYNKVDEVVFFRVQRKFIWKYFKETVKNVFYKERGQFGTKLSAVCPGCFEIRLLEEHHPFPERHFKNDKEKPTIFLCHTCHRKMESYIPKYKRFPKWIYIRLLKSFIQKTTIPIEVEKTLRKEKNNFERKFKKLSN